MLGLFRLRLRGRLIDRSAAAPGWSEAIAWPSRRHVQWIGGRLRVGIVRIDRWIVRGLRGIETTARSRIAPPASAPKSIRRLNQRIGELACWTDMQQSKFLAGQRILVAVPQETDVARGFQIVQILGVKLELAIEQLNAALVLQGAIDGHLFSRALRFEGDARDFHVEGDADRSSHHEHQQERESGLGAAAIFRHICGFHPGISASSGSVCWLLLLNCVSSTTAELIPMRTIL